MPFGKHRGKELGQILADDPAYLDWLRGIDLRPELANAVAAMCEKYSAEIERAIDIFAPAYTALDDAKQKKGRTR